jgi:3alpha(or 20beta)-hydroxysteroid dehydrogenase
MTLRSAPDWMPNARNSGGLVGERLAGKVALITGGARGQGRAEARLFADEGAKVIVTDVLDDEGRALAAAIGAAASYHHLDVSDEVQWHTVIDRVRDSHGRLDVLVNNAGIGIPGTIIDTTLADYRKVIDINQVGTFLGMHVCAPLMRDSGGGSIINVSSMMGFVGGAARVAYTASKFAVRGMTKVAAIELGPLGIRVNSIHPGAIETDFIRPETRHLLNLERLPLRRIGTADDVAKLALFLASDEAAYSTGSEFVIDGGWLSTSAL